MTRRSPHPPAPYPLPTSPDSGEEHPHRGRGGALPLAPAGERGGAQRRGEGFPLRTFLALLAITQAIAATRVVARLVRTANGKRIEAADDAPDEPLSVIVPVLNEAARLEPCLEGLIAQSGNVNEIVIVDGGSTDGTRTLVEAFAARDRRVRLVDAAPVPVGWNGKAWGLSVGRRHVAPAARWVLTVDADVRPAPGLVPALLAHARREGLGALSVATAQTLSGPAEAVLHPAMLTTLVYRYGIPGHRATDVDAVQANGQCFLLQTDVLDRAGGFASGRSSVCEDVTLARSVIAAGESVGFYEAPGLIATAMYADWREAWHNWPRSLPMRDHFAGPGWWARMADVTLAQSVPLPLLVLLTSRRSTACRPLRLVNVVLVLTRLGTLIGTQRAYRAAPATYWLSPLADPLVVFALWRSALRRHHEWRGRSVVRNR